MLKNLLLTRMRQHAVTGWAIVSIAVPSHTTVRPLRRHHITPGEDWRRFPLCKVPRKGMLERFFRSRKVAAVQPANVKVLTIGCNLSSLVAYIRIAVCL